MNKHTQEGVKPSDQLTYTEEFKKRLASKSKC